MDNIDFDFEELYESVGRANLVVTCKTKEEVENFLRHYFDWAKECGISQHTTYRNFVHSTWNRYKDYPDGVSYRIDSQGHINFAHGDYYQTQGYQVIQFSDIINGCSDADWELTPLTNLFEMR